jgi:uncharacterized membrane protein YdbT with pleckstrin-like domain
MGYVQETLVSGEEVVYEGKISVWSLLPKLIIGVLFLIFALSSSIYLAVVSIVFFLWAFLTYISTELAFTNKRVIAKFGFIKRETVELNINKIESIRVNQGIFGRIFNYGSIVIAGAGLAAAPIPGVSKPMVFRNKFMEHTNK